MAEIIHLYGDQAKHPVVTKRKRQRLSDALCQVNAPAGPPAGRAVEQTSAHTRLWLTLIGGSAAIAIVAAALSAPDIPDDSPVRPEFRHAHHKIRKFPPATPAALRP